jgi:hypothetical protein
MKKHKGSEWDKFFFTFCILETKKNVCVNPAGDGEELPPQSHDGSWFCANWTEVSEDDEATSALMSSLSLKTSLRYIFFFKMGSEALAYASIDAHSHLLYYSSF